MHTVNAIIRDELTDSIDVGELERSVAAVAGEDVLTVIQNGYMATLLRILETSLVSHPGMVSLIRTPGVYLGREETEVRKVLQSAGVHDADPEVIDFFIKIIRGRVAHMTSKMSVDHRVFAEVLRLRYESGVDLRCADCGYHFLANDMGQDRLEEARNLGAQLAETTPPERFRDPWKPAKSEYRTLTVDHILPEAALGPGIPQNLRVVCGFCNLRRQIARRQLETLGSRVSSSLLAMAGGIRGQWAIEMAVYFALTQWRVCSECGEDSSSVELTAIPRSGSHKWTGVLPWQLRVCCYEHSGL